MTTPDDPTAMLTGPTPPPMAAGKTAFDRLTVRDLFAAHALQGVLSAHSGDVTLPDAGKAAKWSREYADAMLAELEKPFG